MKIEGGALTFLSKFSCEQLDDSLANCDVSNNMKFIYYWFSYYAELIDWMGMQIKLLDG